MNRTLGFFLGSAVVFGLLVFMLGQPVSLAPPANRDAGLRSATTTAPIRIPDPVSGRVTPPRHEPLQRDVLQPLTPALPAQPALREPEPAAMAISGNPSHGNAEPVPEAKPEAEAEPETVTAEVVAEQHDDETALVENWLASTAALPADGSSDTQTSQQEWYPVWDPFHSELSANAFARRLERLTGLDYRVIKTSATEYRVTMGYTSEEQRLANVAMIEEATGLSITGGSL